jgi:hypothetical protein
MTARPGLFRPARFEVGCTVVIDHSPERFGAHVHLDGEPAIGPGDRVRVTGAPIAVAPGDHLVLRRTAEIVKASAIERAWTRLCGHFEMLELADISFTDGSLA